jgi:polyisoprenyl-teichoic acid--peptidoglycan teichoic acid transferase
VHYYAIVNLVGMKNIIDKLGGVDIDVKKPLYDDTFPTDTCGIQVIQFKPGLQHMDGERAMAYARSRHTTSDFDRADRQQQVLLALRRAALQLDIIPKLPSLLAEYRNLVKTDLSPMEMLALANMAKDIDAADIERYTIGPEMTVDWLTPEGAQVLIPDRAKIRALFEKVFNPGGSTAGGTGG